MELPPVLAAASLAALTLFPPGSSRAATQSPAPPAWSAREAEHLFSRAGFGARPEEIREAVARGRTATIARLCAGPAPEPPRMLAEQHFPGPIVAPEALLERVLERRARPITLQGDHVAPLGLAGAQWAERMLAGSDPLRERMTLFWHGHLATSFKEVGDAHDVIAQIQMLREHALGSFGAILRELARDRAMLQYLSNAKNKKDHPNENWARELMELFTLGDGNYTEDDVKEVARAFTGWTKDDERFRFDRLEHDYGQKTVLGRTGLLDGDDVIERILERPACARFLARKLITFFEGVPPDEARLDESAAQLFSTGYEIRPFLESLFEDPRFYRDEVVGVRISSPVEYVVGLSRRLGLEPPGEMLVSAADVLGQRLYYPPSVKGWESGRGWLTTGSLMQRANVAGALLGVVTFEELLSDPELGAQSSPEDFLSPAGENNQRLTSGFGMLRYVERAGYQPKTALCEALARETGDPNASDARVVAAALDAWLAVPAAPGTSALVQRFLARERGSAGLAEGKLLSGGEAGERLLRRVAHLVESLPEAQLE